MKVSNYYPLKAEVFISNKKIVDCQRFPRRPKCSPDDTTSHYQYRLADHLGNTVVFFEDKDEDGLLTEPEEVMMKKLYYSFGMELEGVEPDTTSPLARYLYNNKEFDENVGHYFYGARGYDPIIGKFTGIDRFAENYSFQSPFAYAANNPISFIDINGDSLDIGGNIEASFGDIQSTIPKKYRNRLSYSEGGRISFNTDGLDRKSDGTLKKPSLAFMEAIVNSKERYLYENTESYEAQVGQTRVISEENSTKTYLVENFKLKSISTENFPDNIVSINPASPYATGDYLNKVTITKGIIPTNQKIPKSGYDAQIAVHPKISFPLIGYSRAGTVKHAIREAYFRTSEGLDYYKAHKKAGGQRGFPPGTIVGNKIH